MIVYSKKNITTNSIAFKTTVLLTMFVLHVISECFLILYSGEFIPPTTHVSDTGFSQKLKIKYILHLPDEPNYHQSDSLFWQWKKFPQVVQFYLLKRKKAVLS